ncbi:unnamed protein product, partial [Discosporangium mesarthrocarpum]
VKEKPTRLPLETKMNMNQFFDIEYLDQVSGRGGVLSWGLCFYDVSVLCPVDRVGESMGGGTWGCSTQAESACLRFFICVLLYSFVAVHVRAYLYTNEMCTGTKT